MTQQCETVAQVRQVVYSLMIFLLSIHAHPIGYTQLTTLLGQAKGQEWSAAQQ